MRPLRFTLLAGLTILCLGACSSTTHSPKDGGQGGGSGSAEGRAFFDNTAKKVLQTSCSSCHSAPFQGGGGAPLSIFVYETAFDKLKNGSASDRNELIYTIRNQIPHPGGDRCKTTPNPCADIDRWWKIEFSNTSFDNPPPLGKFTLIDTDGSIQGWALDTVPGNESLPIGIKFFVDGPKGTGTLLGEVTTDQLVSGLSFPGKHGFKYPLPATVRNGIKRPLHAYSVHPTTQELIKLSGSPRYFTLYSPTPEGRAYYTNNVLPQLNKCLECHTGSGMFVYESAFTHFIGLPLPNAGGGPSTNLIYQKASGSISHVGGNQCGNDRSQSPCPEIMEWWRLEFQ